MITFCALCNSEHEDSPEACPRRAAEAAQTANAPLIGVTIRNRYRLTELLGKGAMGVVYKAVALNDNNDVAIKVLHTHLASDPESLKRFQHEARAASSLLHPHIVRLYDVGMIPGGQPYLAMEYLEGRTLGALLRQKRVFTTKEALPIIRQTCEALAEAHGHGVLHRDIKPANIMLMNRFGQENFVVVLDFSISKVIQKVSDVDTTTPGLIFGSPLYMSPERFMGRGGDFRADIYSMGIIMFQMLAGRAPFKSGDLYTLMNEHVSTIPPRVKEVRPDSDIPDSLEESIARALAKKPEDRHANMRQLLAEINEVYRETSSLLMQTVPALPQDSYPGANQNEGNSPSAGNLSFPAEPQPTPATPAATMNTAANNPPSVFDIDPGLTPTIALNAYQISSTRRKLPEETSSLKQMDRPLSGQLSKSLIVKADANRPAIRPPQKKKGVPLEVIALLIVIIAGIGAIVFSFLPGNAPAPAPTPATVGGANSNGSPAVTSTVSAHGRDATRHSRHQ